MKIETKLSLNNIRKNKKRALFTMISITLCTFLIVTTMIVLSSIENGIKESIIREENDYHLVLRNMNIDDFYKIKNKEYIDKIDTKKSAQKSDAPNDESNLDIYIKYDNVKKTCKYSTNIIQELELSDIEAINNCKFNQSVLTVYGLIDVEVTSIHQATMVRARVNFAYFLNLIILIILVAFSVLFIIILYNAFQITMNERKKEYAVLNSIGATENQILKMVFSEIILIGIIGIFMGSLFALLGAHVFLELLNNILSTISYHFEIIIDIKYMISAYFLILTNIYLAALIPCLKLTNTSIMQDIRNNKQITSKKGNSIFEKIFSIEGRLALKNLKRNKNKYRVITILLVTCMSSYMIISTYISYEKKAVELITEYDVDAELVSDFDIDYEKVLDNYIKKSGNSIEYFEYKQLGPTVLVEPSGAVLEDFPWYDIDKNSQKYMSMRIVSLDDKTYNDYIKKVNANDGDFIICNQISDIPEATEESAYKYYSVLDKTEPNLKLSIVNPIMDSEFNIEGYEIIDDENLKGNFILTDQMVNGYKDFKMQRYPTIFVNRSTYDKISEKFYHYCSQTEFVSRWLTSDEDYKFIRIKTENIIDFSNYMNSLPEKDDIFIRYFSLDNQEKIIYTNVLQLLINSILFIILVIGIVSSVNIINASLLERKQEFILLSSLGATKENVNKILIYECIFMFVKALVIAIILSVPVFYKMIQYMKNTIILNEILIPFGEIFVFFAILFMISLVITLRASKIVKNQ